MKKISQQMVIDSIPIRDKDTYKNKLGKILCVGGDQQKGGAIMMSGLAALYSGAGLVTIASDSVNRTAIHTHAPEIMFTDMDDEASLIQAIEQNDVIVVGPGLGLDDRSAKVLDTVLLYTKEEQRLIIDADAITLIATQRVNNRSKAYTIYTPHMGEWERLAGIHKDEVTIEGNQQIQIKLGATVVLKGSPTRIYFPEAVWENPTGNPSQATGGMGDTLTGVLAGFIGQIQPTELAILSAVYLHSYIADQLAKTHYVTLPTQIIKELPIMMRHFVNLKQAKPITKV